MASVVKTHLTCRGVKMRTNWKRWNEALSYLRIIIPLKCRWGQAEHSLFCRFLSLSNLDRRMGLKFKIWVLTNVFFLPCATCVPHQSCCAHWPPTSGHCQVVNKDLQGKWIQAPVQALPCSSWAISSRHFSPCRYFSPKIRRILVSAQRVVVRTNKAIHSLM